MRSPAPLKIRASLVRIFIAVLVGGAISLAQTPPATIPIHGVVKSGNTPIPGAKLTATDPVTGNKFIAWTDLDGSYVLQVPATGHYSVSVEMPAFAQVTHDVAVEAAGGESNFDLILLSRSQTPSPVGGQRASGSGLGGGRGF